MRQKEIKGLQIGKEEANISLFADDMIGYTENPIDSTKKLFNLINEFGKTSRYKVNIQKSKAFFHTNKISETQIRKKIPFDTAMKHKIPQNKHNQGGKRPVLRKLYNTEERN